MIFGETALDGAAGAVLVHTQRLPGRVLKKGALLDAAAIAALREAGIASVVTARLEPGDVGEDVAADRFATALALGNVTRSRAATGRVNFAAGVPGLLRVNAALIDALNAVHESLTIGTLPDYAVVAPRDMVATVKIIPFAVPGGLLERVEALARAGGPALQVHPFRRLRVGLVMSTLPGLKESVLDGTEEATRTRVERLGGSLLAARRTAHSTAVIAEALRGLRADGAQLLLVAGASAVVDRRDVGPQGVVAAGGEIRHFGMPVDPGNLICLGAIGDCPALVLPGCARSPKLNGIDWVLQRLFAGLVVDGAAIARMGVGGLLKEITERPLPRARAEPKPPRARTAARAPRQVAALVLAAGLSRRMGAANKLLAPLPDGRTMLARTVDNVLSSAARPVIVVLGHQAAEVRAALAGRPIHYVMAQDYAEGLAGSLRAGLAALPADAAAVLVCLGDMPLVPGRVLDRLIGHFDPEEGRRIVVPLYRGTPGNPVLWDRGYVPEMLALTGDAGARRLLAAHAESVAELECDAAGVLRDFDTPEALAELGAAATP